MAELLVIALAGYKSKDSTIGDRDAFVITIHTQLRLVTATFTEAYLRAVQSGTMPATERQDVRRSNFFELKGPDGRKKH